MRNRKKDATEFISYATVSAYKDKDGKIVSFVSTQHDITEQKLAEEKLRKSEEQYRLLVETMNDGLAVVDENMLITFVNDKLCQMIGYAQHELIGQPVDSFLDEHSQRILKRQMDRRRIGKMMLMRLHLREKTGSRYSQLFHQGRFSMRKAALEVPLP